ncbi:DUF1848 domain-containing protein [uncultured Thomasclavelia sp.]|uniref:DUF1848 domain-containing protein n=1 Tax=uncultured Thomasclavelia sp. TaxID=3025759 RepID=UPI0025FFCC24|nr:DUF1848 domain-containing protein [uncultured Thomasclavelia sp.]
MILQVSSRSDICAMYPQWLINRLKAGMVMVRNPYNEHLVSKINLSHEVVDCISFMTKDPLPMLPYLKEIDQLKYQYYFMVTITPYDNDLETNLRPKLEIIKTFRKLSTMLGKKRVIWRYDPILLNARYTKEFHYKMFDKMCALLYQYTEIVIISFIDIYQNISGLFDEINAADVMDLAAKLGKIANKYHLKIQTCSEKYHLEQFGIQHGSCLDRHYLEELIGGKLKIKKNQNRKHCHCVASIDIGAYNSCLNGCKYCYANKQNVYHNVLQHDKNSPLLIGWPTSEDKVVNRKVTSNIDRQIQLKI